MRRAGLRLRRARRRPAPMRAQARRASAAARCETRTKSAALRPPRAARRAARRQHVVRAGRVVAATPARCSRRRRPSPRASAAARSPSVSQTTCSGAMRWLSAIASSERARDDDAAVAPRWPRAPGRSAGICRATSRATAPRQRRDGVNRIARASGSCSACASRSAAIHAGRPVVETIDDLARPGEEVDRAVARRPAPWPRRRTRCRARRSCRRADGRGAVGERRDRVRAAEPEQPR